MTSTRKIHPPLYSHQEKAFELSKFRKNFALWMEMGTGKSRVIIETIYHLHEMKEIDGVVIVAPKGAYLNWVLELDKFLRCFYSLHVWRRGEFLVERHQGPDIGMEIYLINVEAFSFTTPFHKVEDILKKKKTLMVVDESTRIKNHRALRTKALVKLGKLARYKRVMSGSPVTRNPLDLFGQCLFLGPDLLGYTSFFTFRSQYAEVVNIKLGPRSFPKVTGFKNQQELSDKLSRFSFRVLKQDCLDLPPKIYQKHLVELTPKQKEYYDKFKKEAVLELSKADVVSSTSVLTHLLRLHQIVCGHIRTDDGKLVDIESDRVNQLLEVLQDLDGKVIIWANYHQDIQKICQALKETEGPDSFVHYYGQTSDQDRASALESFQSSTSKVRYFIGTPATGGLGLTLTQASNVIYYSNSYNLEHRLQSEDRAHRIGQTKSVTYLDMITPNTVDEKIYKALAYKQDLAKLLLDDLRRGTLPELLF